MYTKKYMIKDENEGTYDIFIFSKEVETEEIKKAIKKIQEIKSNTWTLEDIAEKIKNDFPVEKVVLFWDCDSNDIYFIK